MNWDWGQIGQAFVAAVIGGFVTSLIGLWADGNSKKQARKAQKLARIAEFVVEYGELTELYRFTAVVTQNIATNEGGKPMRNESGNLVIETSILEPNPRFEEAIRELRGTGIESSISQKIASIRLRSAEALDLAQEIDPSEELKKQLTKLYLTTVHSIELIRKYTDPEKPGVMFNRMVNALETADNHRNQVRAHLEKLSN